MPTAERYHQYEILRREDGSLWELGRGAMGITYKAYDTNLRFTVALKVINSAYLESDTARQRFLREARAAAALRHSNVASVFNLGTEKDQYFYVMEFVDGETLEDALPGTLRATLAYPSPETAYKDEELIAALQSAGLNRVSSSLDRVVRWDRELTYGEQRCLAFTRLMLRKPRWVVINQALDALDNETRERVITLFKDELKDTAIINIGRPETKDHLFTRVLHLIKDPYGPCFIPDRSVAIKIDPEPEALSS
jgi:hypothetical protein